MKTPMIEVDGLTKKFGAFTAVDQISFSVSQGQCFGLLGQNGAGKTTTIQILTCLSEPTSGSAKIFGETASLKNRNIKAQIGVVHQNETLDTDFSTYKNLLVHGSYFLINKQKLTSRADYLIDCFDLKDQKDLPIHALSGGMKRRLQLAKSLINDPKIIFLDEPTTGLDPHARIQLWELIKSLKNQNKTIIISSHYMDEIERLCDQVLLMQRGEILENGIPKELIQNRLGKNLLEVQLAQNSEATINYLKDKNILFEKHGSKLHIFNNELNEIYMNLAHFVDTKDLFLRPCNLEDYYLSVSKGQNEY